MGDYAPAIEQYRRTCARKPLWLSAMGHRSEREEVAQHSKSVKSQTRDFGKAKPAENRRAEFQRKLCRK